MSFKSSGFRVKRSLSFTSKELPYASKTFYIDVKSCSLKAKLSQRILNLGGQIENFLSKDLTLLITDKHDEGNNLVYETENNPTISTLNHSIPLSREDLEAIA
ncbi:Zinc finger protein [Mactra antiquata]